MCGRGSRRYFFELARADLGMAPFLRFFRKFLRLGIRISSPSEVFCVFVALGCMMKLEAILDFSDAMVFVLCVPNVLGLYLLAPVVQRELAGYRQRHRQV